MLVAFGTLLVSICDTFVIASPYGSSAGALDAESPKSKSKQNKNERLFGHGIAVFLTDLHPILHAMREAVTTSNGSRIFPSPPRPLKRPKNFNLLCFSKFYFEGLLFRAHFGYGYTSRAEAITFVIGSPFWAAPQCAKHRQTIANANRKHRR